MPRRAQALAFSKFQGPLFQPIRAPYLSEDPQKPRLPSSTLNSGPNRSKLKYVLRGTLNRTLSDSYIVRPCRCRVVRRRRAPSVRKVIFQGSYRYRPVTQLSHTKNALIHPSDVTAAVLLSPIWGAALLIKEVVKNSEVSFGVEVSF